MIIPSILALTYLGLSIYLDLLPDLNLLPLGIWLAAVGTNFIADDIKKLSGVILQLLSVSPSPWP